jgi:tetratricopeptide (TPR) repeat protein
MTSRRPGRRAADPVSPHMFDEAFALVLSLPSRRPASGQARRLETLFRELASEDPPRDPEEISDLIWAHWIAHRDRVASGAMAAAIEAMGLGEFDLARPILDRLVESEPRWSEAWNKRATLSFIEKRDEDALFDITRTLLLEPRHFGAVSGFGQICVRQGRLTEARAAFQVALAINPWLDGVSEAIDQLERVTRGRLH